jgi:predicted nucleic acid-binding protein
VILDANVAVALVFEHPFSGAAARLAAAPFAAPRLMIVETANTLWKYAVHGTISQNDVILAIERVAQLGEFVSDEILLHAAIPIAIANRHPVYDCLYLALAQQRSEPLATGDKKLAALARQLAIEVELIGPAV